MSIVTGNNMGDVDAVRASGGAWWDVRVSHRGRILSVSSNPDFGWLEPGDEIVLSHPWGDEATRLVFTLFAGSHREAEAKVEGMIVREIARSIMEVEWG